MRCKKLILTIFLVFCLIFSACGTAAGNTGKIIDIASVPDYCGEPYAVINGNVPEFSEDELTTEPFESYSELDMLGRCGTAYANVCREIMPTEERGSIGQVKPTGWHTVKYDFVDGKYLYNRCHLIGFQLAGENANERNLITGTRYMNVDGMLPFENMVADYVKETDNHVLYRVTPVFEGGDLVASGVQIEAMSVEDKGEGILFNVYCYNVQPGVEIDYSTGDSSLTSDTKQDDNAADETTYILNTNSKKFHYPDCSGAESISEANKQTYTGARDELLEKGYEPCGRCKP